MQFEMGISTRRYFPANGTAGLARSFVRGNNRVPCPPPMMTESTLLVLADCRPVCDIQILFGLLLKPSLRGTQEGKRWVLRLAGGAASTPAPRAAIYASHEMS